MKTFYCEAHGVTTLTPDNSLTIHDKLPAGTYSVILTEEGYKLKTIENMVVPDKLYGNPEKTKSRILTTAESRKGSTGVLLSGLKGSGKTMLARIMSKELREENVPTIVVEQSFFGTAFNDFISSINQPALVLFDEFEKTYDREQQEALLTLFDGVHVNKKLFVVTCNNVHSIDVNMKNRPGRFFYHIEFTTLDEAFITDYCNDKLEDKEQIPSVITFGNMFHDFNFDMLQALIEEMNRYGESVSEASTYLNAKADADFNKFYDIVDIQFHGKNKEILKHGCKLEENSVYGSIGDGFTVGLHFFDPERYARQHADPEETVVGNANNEMTLLRLKLPNPDDAGLDTSFSPKGKKGTEIIPMPRDEAGEPLEYNRARRFSIVSDDLKTVTNGKLYTFETADITVTLCEAAVKKYDYRDYL